MNDKFLSDRPDSGIIFSNNKKQKLRYQSAKTCVPNNNVKFLDL